jgi:hypothetical protein
MHAHRVTTRVRLLAYSAPAVCERRPLAAVFPPVIARSGPGGCCAGVVVRHANVNLVWINPLRQIAPLLQYRANLNRLTTIYSTHRHCLQHCLGLWSTTFS